jgi:uncharacterized protein
MPEVEAINCKYCGFPLKYKAQFCSHCGKQVRGDRIDYLDANKKYFVRTIVLYVLLVLFLGVNYVIIQHYDAFISEIAANCMFLCTVIIFIVLDPKPFFLLLFTRFKIKPFLLIFGFVIILYPIVHFFVHFINTSLYNVDFRYTDSYFNTQHPILYAYLFVSVAPGIIEEFMFRGIMFNQLLFLTSPKFTILITAVTFSFAHFSFVSLFWLIPFGLFLGYLRYRYRTMLYGIFCHMLYNAIVVSIELLY